MNDRAPFSTAPTCGSFYYEEMDSKSLFQRMAEDIAISRRVFKVLHELYGDLEEFIIATYLPVDCISHEESETVVALLLQAANELRILSPEHNMMEDGEGNILHHFTVVCRA